MTTEQPKVSAAGRYSVKQAARAMHVCENTIYNWIYGGVFHATEYGRRGVGSRALYIKGIALIRVWNQNF